MQYSHQTVVHHAREETMADTYLIYRIDAQGRKRILHSVDTEEKAKLGVSRCETAPERRFDNFYGWELKPSTPGSKDVPSVSACVGCLFNIGENSTECIEPTASQMTSCCTFVCACVWRQTSRPANCRCHSDGTMNIDCPVHQAGIRSAASTGSQAWTI